MFSRVLGNSSYVVSFFCFLEVDGIVPFLTIRGNVPQLLIIPVSLFYFSASLPPFSLLRDFSFQNTSEHFAIRFRQSYLIWEVCDVTAIELSSKE